MPGVAGPVRYQVNSLGVRGDELTPDDDLVLLAIGSSTTQCAFIDQNETWPALVQRRLRAAGRRAWVGNAGLSGRTTRENVPQLRKLLEEFPSTRIVILLIGANDLAYRLSAGDRYRPTPVLDARAEMAIVPKAFSVFPVRYDASLPFWERTELWGRTRTVFETLRLKAEHIDDEAGRSYVLRRERRRSATFRRVLPDLASALEEYSANIERMIDLAAGRVQLVFVTQPAMWREDLPPELDRLLWFGDANPDGYPPQYYSTEALAEGLGRYNQTLLRICAQRRLPCLDLEPVVPRDTTAFYDDVHFNRQGAEIVASHVADFLLENVLGDARTSDGARAE
jgi:lysophospholipase L1-like esterase